MYTLITIYLLCLSLVWYLYFKDKDRDKGIRSLTWAIWLAVLTLPGVVCVLLFGAVWILNNLP